MSNIRRLCALTIFVLFVNVAEPHADQTNVSDCSQHLLRNLSSHCLRYKLMQSFDKFQLLPLKIVKFPLAANRIGKHETSSTLEENDYKGYRSSPSSSSLFTLLADRINSALSKYAIKMPLPEPTNEFPGILIEEQEEDRPRDRQLLIAKGRGRIKKETKKYAMLFPIIATIKFIVIKVLLIPILLVVLVIKKIIVLTIMALPTIVALFRICRGGGLFGANIVGTPGNGALAGPIAPYSSATDAIVGDFSSYSYITQSPYYSRHDYGGRNYIPVE